MNNPTNDTERWATNKEAARFTGVSLMTHYRRRHNPGLDYPRPFVINGVPFWKLAELDAWMKSRRFETPKAETA
jgi:predicted DNA-binding transcriptional regulator AlpA